MCISQWLWMGDFPHADYVSNGNDIQTTLFKAKVEIHVAKKPVPIYESEERGSSDISETFMKA